MSNKNKKSNKNSKPIKLERWTPEQDKILIEGVAKGMSYKLIAGKIGINKTVKSCQNRAYALRKKGLLQITEVKPEVKTKVKTKVEPDKKKKVKRWTKEEDNCLRNQMAIHDDCFEDGFVATSRLTGRSISSCRARWYQYVSLDESKEPVIVMGSKDKQIINRRYFSRPSLIKQRDESWWKKVCCFFGFSKK
jgi:hypothetical protein